MTPEAPSIEVLMAVHNGAAWLDAVLASLAAQTHPNFRLTVWDNASTDERWAPAPARAGREGGRVSDDLKARVAELTEQLRYHNERYYTDDDPEIADDDCDALLNELRAIEAEHPDLLTEDSPTQVVGATGWLGAAISLPRKRSCFPQRSRVGTVTRGEVGGSGWARSEAR